jgi:peptide deformylase
MAKITIKTYPDPCLLDISEPVEKGTQEVIDTLDRMAELVTQQQGAGLAAPQIGINKRLIVVRIDNRVYQYINPEIIEKSDEVVEDYEGCLSLPGVILKVPRAKTIKVRVYTLTGKKQTFEAAGLMARVIQHEIDHLDGKLLIDYYGPTNYTLL